MVATCTLELSQKGLYGPHTSRPYTLVITGKPSCALRGNTTTPFECKIYAFIRPWVLEAYIYITHLVDQIHGHTLHVFQLERRICPCESRWRNERC